MREAGDGDLGFTFSTNKKGDLVINHRGKVATKFSGTKGSRIAEKLEDSSFPDQQQQMARLTGNYKRGNEKQSKAASNV